ncbi:MAG: hypothetical protein RLZZ40_956 [Actinomycetota bacterium]
MPTTTRVHHLTADGVSLVVDVSSGAPIVVHWGAALGKSDLTHITDITTRATPHGLLDATPGRGVKRDASQGFLGRPSLLGHRDGLDWSTQRQIQTVSQNGNELVVVSADENAGIRVTTTFHLGVDGVLEVDKQLANTGSTNYYLQELSYWLPLPDRAAESMDFAGRWLKERQPQRRPINHGQWVREGREGRPGHDHTIVQLAMTAGANFASGEVWAMGLKWSGNPRYVIDKNQNGNIAMGAMEALLPGEVILGPGETYDAPAIAATYSATGIDGISDRYYRAIRARDNHHTRPRPLTLNVWEAVYFDHSLEKLTALAEVAGEIGVERFVLDDGWFGSRRDDTSGLGDWVVSPKVWPNGLKPLIDVVHKNGMEFGLWFEAEMVQPDSDLYRAHPDWILHIPGRIPVMGRGQHVLDLTHPGAFDHVLGQVDAVLSENDIAYIKWDHNMVLLEPGHLGRPAVREQTLALYRLFDELKRRHPGLEIESCASGGGRVDLGMVDHADRFWTSDTNDAFERQSIQRWTGIAIPPEMLGTHIGPARAHTTGRTHDLSFRAIAALFGHAGLEWDLTGTTVEERAALTNWADYYKANRDLLHTGRVVRVDHVEEESLVHGVVAQDGSRALFAYVALSTTPDSTPASICLTGLDDSAVYHVAVAQPAGDAKVVQRVAPTWTDGVTLSGVVLRTVGLRPPILAPEQAFLLEVTRVK